MKSKAMSRRSHDEDEHFDARQPNPVDVHVGARLKTQRALKGLSQERLADAIGLTFQQIQKYERGANRVSASRLYQFSKILNVPVSYFFEEYRDIGKATALPSTSQEYGFAEGDQAGSEIDQALIAKKETVDLIRAYYSIPDAKVRKDLMKMLKSMAENMKGQD
jgi:transcriptional regulator with XRE-family HTH domain